MKLLKLRARALQLSPTERSLEVLLEETDPQKRQENMTMALYTCSYDEYHRWRLDQLRQHFPTSMDHFVAHWETYQETVRQFYQRLEMLEMHFSIVSPDVYQSWHEVAIPFLLEEFVEKQWVSYLFSMTDTLFQYRRHGRVHVLDPLRDVLALLEAWKHCLPLFEGVWKQVYRMTYEYQSRGHQNLDTNDIVSVEYHLSMEQTLSRYLPCSTCFYEEVLSLVIPQCTFPWSFETLCYCSRVMDGVLRYRPFDFLHEWETYMEHTWSTDPWKAVGQTRKLWYFLDPEEEIGERVLKNHQTRVDRHAPFLAKTLHQQSEERMDWLVEHTDLQKLGPAYMQHIWVFRETISEKYVEKIGRRFLPLRSLFFDMLESVPLFQYDKVGILACRDTLQYPAHWPMEAIQPHLLPQGFMDWKQTFGEIYREKYPHRKWVWLDFHSTVELDNAKMSLPHFLILQHVERQGGSLSLTDLAAYLGWNTMYLQALVDSMVPQLLVQSEEQHYTFSTAPWPRFLHLSLPILNQGAPPPRHDSRRSEEEERRVIQARVVRCLKQQGPFSEAQLVSMTKCTPTILEQLVHQEYIRSDEHGLFHYVP